MLSIFSYWKEDPFWLVLRQKEILLQLHTHESSNGLAGHNKATVTTYLHEFCLGNNNFPYWPI